LHDVFLQNVVITLLTEKNSWACRVKFKRSYTDFWPDCCDGPCSVERPRCGHQVYSVSLIGPRRSQAGGQIVELEPCLERVEEMERLEKRRGRVISVE